jgi:general secretion pathway protein K
MIGAGTFAGDVVTHARQRGFVLLVVLWTVGLLALIGSHITAGARGAMAQAAALRVGAVANVTVDGLVNEAMYHLLDPGPRRWVPGPLPQRIVLGRGTAEMLVTNEAGRINLNYATADMLNALLRAVGATQAQARPLATAIAEWHLPGDANPAPYVAAHLPYLPPGAKFLDTDELSLVPGMDAGLLARLAPHITVQSDGRIDLTAADPVVARVVQSLPADQRPPAPDAQSPLVLRIAAHAVLPDGAARREAVIRIDLSDDDPAANCVILAWN